jgi:heparanase
MSIASRRWSRRKTVSVMASTLCLAPSAYADTVAPGPVAIDVRAMSPLHRTDERFMSFQVGFSHLTGGETWRSYDTLKEGAGGAAGFAGVREARAPADLTNRRLLTLVRALGPFYLRYSGTTANSVYFHDSDAPPPAAAPEGFTVLLTRERWKQAVAFARAVDARIITSFANSPGVRDAEGVWTPRMAAPWLAYTRSIGGEIYAAELYNEPNAPEPPKVPHGHSPEEFARDYAAFSTFMRQAAPQVRLAGPGVAVNAIPIPRIDGLSAEMYAAASPTPKFDLFSYHFYPVVAERCLPPTMPGGITADKALTTEWLARPDAQFARHKAARDRFAPGAPLWLTETGGAACGGLRWQPEFLDVFRFADTHARLARQGLDVIVSHALISGSNGVIDEKTFQPNASYWAALLWRRLMGAQTLDAGAHRPGLQLYAHCQRGAAGGVTLLALNLDDAPKSLAVPGAARIYALTSPDLRSRTVRLNGRVLALDPRDRLPAMTPLRAASGTVTLPALSVSYIALPQARNPACR